MTHADRDGSERELSAYLAADKAEPAPDADRVDAYAEREVLWVQSIYPQPNEYPLLFGTIVTRAIALADREQATLLARISKLEAEVDAMPYCSRVYYQREAVRAEAAERALADERAKVAELHAEDTEWAASYLRLDESHKRLLDKVARVERALADELANLADDGARLSHSVVRRIEAALAGDV